MRLHLDATVLDAIPGATATTVQLSLPKFT